MTKILIIEDDEALAEGICFALEREGWDLKVAGSLKEGRCYFEQGSYNMIILDVMLPDGNGFELCKEIRRISNLPILFLTACDEEFNIVRGLDIGGDDYITKPFRLQEMISRIKALLRRSTENNTIPVQTYSRIISGDYTLLLSEGKFMKEGVEVALTITEYKLLTLFMCNPMQLLERNHILSKLWDIDGEYIDDNTLSVYIRRLREKLEKNPTNPLVITTVRGMGYKWNQNCRQV